MRARTLLVAACAGILLTSCGAATGTGSRTSPTAATSGGTGAGTGTGSGTVTPTNSWPDTTSPTPPGGGTGGVGPAMAAGYLPLFPFAGPGAVAAWQRGYRSTGVQPWHLDPAQTAVAFARGLGYTEVDRATTTRVHGPDATVGVGWKDPNEGTATVALVHLMRFGTDADAPWEVVGTQDRTLSLTSPRYGATVGRTVTVGGRITGVDESLRVQAVGPGGGPVLASAGPVPAGGTDQPWTATLRLPAGTTGVVTISVSTGGHLSAVEQFAVTGVRVSG